MAAERVKEMQRTDPVARDQWYAYCEQYGEGVRDPNKHEASFLEGFIASYHAGERLEFKEGQMLITMIKLGQKKSAGWKMCWEQYCNQVQVDGKTAHDPAKHTTAHLEGFFDYIGKRAAAVAGPQMAAAVGLPSAKRSRTDASGAWIATGNGEVVDLASKVKEFQRQGQSQKEAWHTYCDTHLGGMRDPSRQDAATLQNFLVSHGVTISGSATMPMAGGFAGFQPFGAVQVAGGAAAAQPNAPLVQRVKAYQRMGETQKQTWHNYCDTNLSGVRDPSRHDAHTLQTFISTYGVA